MNICDLKFRWEIYIFAVIVWRLLYCDVFVNAIAYDTQLQNLFELVQRLTNELQDQDMLELYFFEHDNVFDIQFF